MFKSKVLLLLLYFWIKQSFTIIALLLGGTKFLLTIGFVFKNKIKRINDIKK